MWKRVICIGTLGVAIGVVTLVVRANDYYQTCTTVDAMCDSGTSIEQTSPPAGCSGMSTLDCGDNPIAKSCNVMDASLGRYCYVHWSDTFDTCTGEAEPCGLVVNNRCSINNIGQCQPGANDYTSEPCNSIPCGS